MTERTLRSAIRIPLTALDVLVNATADLVGTETGARVWWMLPREAAPPDFVEGGFEGGFELADAADVPAPDGSAPEGAIVPTDPGPPDDGADEPLPEPEHPAAPSDTATAVARPIAALDDREQAGADVSAMRIPPEITLRLTLDVNRM